MGQSRDGESNSVDYMSVQTQRTPAMTCSMRISVSIRQELTSLTPMFRPTSDRFHVRICLRRLVSQETDL